MSYRKLKLRIKKNEGYSAKPYKDQLGFYTIGYGHLIKSNEKHYFKSNFTKKEFNTIFDLDFDKALKTYKKLFYVKSHNIRETELIVEMLFQLGSKGVSKFKRMLFYLNTKQRYMACLEMMNSLWYKQTPERVNDLIKNFIKQQ